MNERSLKLLMKMKNKLKKRRKLNLLMKLHWFKDLVTKNKESKKSFTTTTQ